MNTVMITIGILWCLFALYMIIKHNKYKIVKVSDKNKEEEIESDIGLDNNTLRIIPQEKIDILITGSNNGLFTNILQFVNRSRDTCALIRIPRIITDVSFVRVCPVYPSLGQVINFYMFGSHNHRISIVEYDVTKPRNPTKTENNFVGSSTPKVYFKHKSGLIYVPKVKYTKINNNKKHCEVIFNTEGFVNGTVYDIGIDGSYSVNHEAKDILKGLDNDDLTSLIEQFDHMGFGSFGRTNANVENLTIGSKRILLDYDKGCINEEICKTVLG